MIDADDIDVHPDDPPGRLRTKLPRPEPPDALRARVERSLQAAQLLTTGSRFPGWRIRALYAIAAASLFAVGYVVGSSGTRQKPSAVESEPRFALLLYAPEKGLSTGDDVAEHQEWARRIRGGGHSIYGEKLGSYTVTIGGDAASVTDTNLQGFFVISAANETEALAIARSSPHFRHGGRVVVRKIDPT